MRKASRLLTPIVSVALSAVAFGQAPTEEPAPKPAAPPPAAAVQPCPKIEVQSQSAKVVREGQQLSFLANVQGGDPKVAPQIIWSVSGGSIRSGQEGRKVEVDSTGAGAYREIVASVWVGGYAPECGAQASATVRVIPPAVKVDEFGELGEQKEKEQMASIAAALGQSDDRLHVIVYAGRTSERGYSSTVLRRLRGLLMSSGLEETRIGVADGGYREQPTIELWVVPQGADTPRATPTIDRRELVSPRTVPPARQPRKP